MFDELSDILRNRVSPEVLSGISELTLALEKHDAVMYKDRINQLAMDANNKDQITLHDEAIAIVYGQINALLQQMHLVIDVDNLQMSRLARILEALVFEPSDDDDELVRIIEESEDSVDALVEILAVKLICQPEEIMDVIHVVPEETITAIGEKLQVNLRGSERATEGLQETVKLLNQHAGLTIDTTVGMESLQQSTELVGTDPMVLLEQHREKMLALEPAQMADQVISIVLISGVGVDELLDEVMSYIEMITHDPFVVQKAYKHTVNRVAELRKQP